MEEKQLTREEQQLLENLAQVEQCVNISFQTNIIQNTSLDEKKKITQSFENVGQGIIALIQLQKEVSKLRENLAEKEAALKEFNNSVKEMKAAKKN
ncbi:MAG: hypothetical protein ACPGFK_00615 [Flavobacteriaceae bacterium]